MVLIVQVLFNRGNYSINDCIDLIAQSQSGTGKTGAFSIGLLARIKPNYQGLQGLILSPTRELAQQTNYVLKSLASNMNLKIEEFIGGTEVKENGKIQEGVQIASNSRKII